MDIRKTLKKLEQINEGELSELVPSAEMDHEVQMARSQLFSIAEYAIKLHNLLKHIPEERGIEGWMQAKITKAADYMDAVWHNLEHDLLPPDHELALDVRTAQQPDMGMDVDLTDGIAEEINESSIAKNLKRGMQGWDKSMTGLDGEKNTPQQMRKRIRDMDDKFLAQLARGSKEGDSPRAVQARMANQELRRRAVINSMNEASTKDSINNLKAEYEKLTGKKAPAGTSKQAMVIMIDKAKAASKKEVDEASMKVDPMLKDFDQHMDNNDAKGLAVKVKQAADKAGKDPVGVVKHHMLRLDDRGHEFARKVMQHIKDINESKTTNKTFGFWGE